MMPWPVIAYMNEPPRSGRLFTSGSSSLPCGSQSFPPQTLTSSAARSASSKYRMTWPISVLPVCSPTYFLDISKVR